MHVAKFPNTEGGGRGGGRETFFKGALGGTLHMCVPASKPRAASFFRNSPRLCGGGGGCGCGGFVSLSGPFQQLEAREMSKNIRTLTDMRAAARDGFSYSGLDFLRFFPPVLLLLLLLLHWDG